MVLFEVAMVGKRGARERKHHVRRFAVMAENASQAIEKVRTGGYSLAGVQDVIVVSGGVHSVMELPAASWMPDAVEALKHFIRGL